VVPERHIHGTLFAMRTILLLLGLGLASCSKSDPPAPPAATKPTKDPAAARTLIQGGATVLDVRTSDEFASGHLDKAVNLPVGELPAKITEVATLVGGDRSRPIVVYCAAGSRAAKAKAALEAEGFTQVVNGGGYDDLR